MACQNQNKKSNFGMEPIKCVLQLKKPLTMFKNEYDYFDHAKCFYENSIKFTDIFAIKHFLIS
jgi:hypothetical protein